MTEPHCLCEQCKMTVLQCKERSAKESSDMLDELENRINKYDREHAVCEAKILIEQLCEWIAELRTKERER